jgi:hypothetical protein
MKLIRGLLSLALLSLALLTLALLALALLAVAFLRRQNSGEMLRRRCH